MINKIKSNFLLISLLVFSVVVLAVNLRINFFRYNNFDFGKFDLGNMAQMIWYTLHGKLLWLTDYFGTNLPRWAMSHVDPILLLFVPIFAIFPHAMTLVVSQLVLVTFSSVLVYLISELELKSKLAAFFIGLAYLIYPAVGFLTAWTGFHGVTAAIPFFLAAFYVYERMHKQGRFTKKGIALFWVLLIIVMAGKEQLPLYVFIYGIFIWLFRNNLKQGIWMMVAGMLWFILAFFVIIPHFAHYRIDGYAKFARSLDLDTSETRDVENDNYFLSRYEEFGDSYAEVILTMITHPNALVRVFFGGDKLDNLRRTFEPVGYLPLAFPQILIISAPDFLINYLTTAGGIGTSEIYNHRVSMIVPVIFLSVIYAVAFLSKLINKKWALYFLSALVLGTNIYTTFSYNNPVYLWLTQAVKKRLAVNIAYAKSDTEIYQRTDLKVGEVFRLSPLEDKDRECAQKVIAMVPPTASVSGPDYLGAHLGLRETYAIFPALYKEADYVIVDVFSRKILTILDADVTLVRDVVGDLVKDETYQLETGCGNLFVFRKVNAHSKDPLLPLQEKFNYPEKMNFEISQTLHVVDYTLPKEFIRSVPDNAKFVYIKRNNNSLDDYVLFMTFINNRTGEIYQVGNLPSFGLQQLKEWSEDVYYIEDIELVLPGYLDTGSYKAFIGMSNKIKTRSMYLGDVEVR